MVERIIKSGSDGLDASAATETKSENSNPTSVASASTSDNVSDAPAENADKNADTATDSAAASADAADSSSSENSNTSPDVIGVICGSGEYPKQVVRACVNKGIDCCAVFINNNDSEIFKDVPYIKTTLGEIGAAVNFFRSRNVNKIVFAGAVKRPNFTELTLDAKGAFWLMKLGRAIFEGDDVLLKEIANLLEKDGFEIVAGTDLIGSEAVFVEKTEKTEEAEKGDSSTITAITAKEPTENEKADIRKGFEVAKTIGKLDIGQAVIVCDGIVLGVECAEGTDELIKRCAALRKSESGGVLVKTSKPQQDQRMDLPTVGLNTLANLHEHRFSGLAIENGRCIVLEKEAFMKKCEELSLFFLGVDGENGGK